MILAMSSTGWPLAGFLTAISALLGASVVIAKVGDKSGKFEEHLTGQDDKLGELKVTLEKQDEVLDAQNIALAELRTELKALRDQH